MRFVPIIQIYTLKVHWSIHNLALTMRKYKVKYISIVDAIQSIPTDLEKNIKE